MVGIILLLFLSCIPLTFTYTSKDYIIYRLNHPFSTLAYFDDFIYYKLHLFYILVFFWNACFIYYFNTIQSNIKFWFIQFSNRKCIYWFFSRSPLYYIIWYIELGSYCIVGMREMLAIQHNMIYKLHFKYWWILQRQILLRPVGEVVAGGARLSEVDGPLGEVVVGGARRSKVDGPVDEVVTGGVVKWMGHSTKSLPLDSMFPIVDDRKWHGRCFSMVDPRILDYFRSP